MVADARLYAKLDEASTIYQHFLSIEETKFWPNEH